MASSTIPHLVIPHPSELEYYLQELTREFGHLWDVSVNHQIPKQAIFVANHPYLHIDDWIPTEWISQEWGQNEFDYPFIHVPVVRSLLLQKLCPHIQTVIKPIGYRKLMECLNCIHLPPSNGYLFLKDQILSGKMLLLFPEGGYKTGKIHSSFATLAESLNLEIVFLKFSDTVSLTSESTLTVKRKSKISNKEEGISLFRSLCLG